MRLDDDDLDEMVSKGRKVNGYEKPAPAENHELKALQAIAKKLEYLITRPAPPVPEPPEIKAPIVNVAPPAVTINPSKPITKWKFVLTKNKAGHTTEIIATAIE